MPQGRPLVIPDDGRTTRARRNSPILAVHTGAGKGKSTAAFGMALRAWNCGFDIAEVVATLRDRPGNQNVVITGRDAHPDLVDLADLVTDMTKVRHPMDAGRKGQQGIEW